MDGYIAKPNDDLSFLDRVQIDGEDYGYNDFIASVDTVLIGRKTYDWVMRQVDVFPHADKETYVITRTCMPPKDNITFYDGNIGELILNLKNKSGKNIFCDGGAEIANELFNEKLFDELIISIIPVILGNGVRLFIDGTPEQNLQLISSKAYLSGLVQLHYQLVK